MVSGNDPVQAVNYVCYLKLFWIVFSLPSNVEPPVSEMCERVYTMYINGASKLIHFN
ncbi:hypothetical protein Droror1_Dr00022610 [Drosera rotundifolia]